MIEVRTSRASIRGVLPRQPSDFGEIGRVVAVRRGDGSDQRIDCCRRASRKVERRQGGEILGGDSGGKGDGEPLKSGGKGGFADGNGGNVDVAVDIFQRVAELGGMLTVSIVTPIGGSRSGNAQTNARRSALADVARQAVLRAREEANAARALEPKEVTPSGAAAPR